jgi:hypothetical protein
VASTVSTGDRRGHGRALAGVRQFTQNGVLVPTMRQFPSAVRAFCEAIGSEQPFSLPVIATRAFGLPELIEDGVTGYLCDARDIGNLRRCSTAS